MTISLFFFFTGLLLFLLIEDSRTGTFVFFYSLKRLKQSRGIHSKMMHLDEKTKCTAEINITMLETSHGSEAGGLQLASLLCIWPAV